MPNKESRVILISYTYQPATTVVDYTHFLRENGLDVDLVVWDLQRWTNHLPELPTDIRLHGVKELETRLTVRRLESLLLWRIPGGALERVRAVARSNKLTRPLARPALKCQRVHKRLARTLHTRIFLPYYRVVRPRMLGLATMKALRDVEFGTVDRIVATDAQAIPCAAHLARRFPGAAACTNLDRHTYLARGEPEPAVV